MRNTRYDFSSVHIEVPHELAQEIIHWGRENVSDDDIFVSQLEPNFGREDEIHITILYGIHASNPAPVVSLLSGQTPVSVELGKIGVFPSNKFDVIMIDVLSPDLFRLNQILQPVEHTNRYGYYEPHITIAYAKKGKGWRHVGDPTWEGRVFSSNTAVFSSKYGVKDTIVF